MHNYYNYNHGDYCHDNRSEELVHTLPIIAGDGSTVNMEMSLMNQSESKMMIILKRQEVVCCVV